MPAPNCGANCHTCAFSSPRPTMSGATPRQPHTSSRFPGRSKARTATASTAQLSGERRWKPEKSTKNTQRTCTRPPPHSRPPSLYIPQPSSFWDGHPFSAPWTISKLERRRTYESCNAPGLARYVTIIDNPALTATSVPPAGRGRVRPKSEARACWARLPTGSAGQ